MKILGREMILLSIIAFCARAAAPTVNGKFVLLTNNGTTYSVKVQLQATVATGMGTATVAFSFANANLSFPASPVAGTDYIIDPTLAGYATYDQLDVSRPNPTHVSINIDYVGAKNGGFVIGTDWTDIATINFTTTIAAGNSNLIFTSKLISEDDNATAFGVGTYTGLNTTPLPVELTSFTASANRLNAQLKWSTATEKNNYGWNIERRSVEIANAAWAKVGFVQGAGSSASPKQYSFVDASAAPGRYAYRLKQIDNDGGFKYSESTELEIGLVAKVLTLSSNYPNPFNPATTIEFTLAADGKAVLKVYNELGQQVAELFNGEAQAGRIIQTHFDASRLASGIYFSRLEAGGKSLVKRMMLVK